MVLILLLPLLHYDNKIALDILLHCQDHSTFCVYDLCVH